MEDVSSRIDAGIVTIIWFPEPISIHIIGTMVKRGGDYSASQ
jgi:hypothetical protein